MEKYTETFPHTENFALDHQEGNTRKEQTNLEKQEEKIIEKSERDVESFGLNRRHSPNLFFVVSSQPPHAPPVLTHHILQLCLHRILSQTCQRLGRCAPYTHREAAPLRLDGLSRIWKLWPSGGVETLWQVSHLYFSSIFQKKDETFMFLQSLSKKKK